MPSTRESQRVHRTFDALVGVINGEAVITVPGEDTKLKAGEAIIVPVG